LAILWDARNVGIILRLAMAGDKPGTPNGVSATPAASTPQPIDGTFSILAAESAESGKSLTSRLPYRTEVGHGTEAVDNVDQIALESVMQDRTACGYFRSQSAMSDESIQLVEQHAYEYGETYDSYLVTEPDREYFWSRDQRGVVAFCRRGRHIIVAGNLLARPEDREPLLIQLLEFARTKRWSVSFVNVPRSHTQLLRSYGFEITKWGEEPIIRLQDATWQGQEYAWVRRQESFCKQRGVEFREIVADPSDSLYREQIVPQLEAISRSHIASTLHKRELPFFEGQFCPLDLRRRRLFVATHAGRIVAFLVCNPGLASELWAVEIYRRFPDAVRGVIPYLIMQTLRTMKAEGVSYVSLSLIPFLRCETAVTGDSNIMRFAASFWWRHLNSIFDMRGIYHFKSRFRPDYREMYVAALPGLTVRRAFSLALAWKLLNFNPLRLLRRELAKRAISSQRRSLATPQWRPERVIRELRTRLPAATISDSQACTPTELTTPIPVEK
jgi:phosphatidylglycerol lysyltransferase